MRDMTVGQDHAVSPHRRFPSVTRAAMDGHKFPDGCIVINLNRCFFAIEFKVLRICRDNGPRKDLAIFSDPRTLHDRHITPDPGSCSDLNIFMNHGEWVHLNTGAEARIRVDGGERMDHSAVTWLVFSFLNHYYLVLGDACFLHKYC